MHELLGLGAKLHAENGFQRGLARCRADGALELRRAQAMEETVVRSRAVQRAESSAEGVRQNRLTAEFGADGPESRSDRVQSLIPGNALPGYCGAGTHARGPFRATSTHGIQHAPRRIH